MGGCSATRSRVCACVIAMIAACPLQSQSVGPQFVDATMESGLGGTIHSPSGPFLTYQLNLAVMTGGGAVADFNGDGFLDIYWIGGGGVPDALFINQGDGTFVNEAQQWGIAITHMGIGACVGDFNGDGRPDLYVTSLGSSPGLPRLHSHRLYRNDGGFFTEVAVEMGVHSNGGSLADAFGCVFGDYDLDGDLDLMVVGWTGMANHRLFRNDQRETGQPGFTNVTGPGVITIPNGTRGFTPIFADMNGDRYPELLLAADFRTSRYFRNNANGSFTNITFQSGTGMDGNGMGATVADINGDGRPDWYVSSIYSVHGTVSTWIPGTGNMLYINTGHHNYLEQSALYGVKDGGWGWGTVAVDLNNDGLIDIAETNGWHETNGVGEPEWQNDACRMFLNLGSGSFVDLGVACGVDHAGMGRGMIAFDADNDGRMDLLVFTFNGELKFYRNITAHHSTGAPTNSIRIQLDTSLMPCLAPDGYGAKVTVRTTDALGGQRSAVSLINTMGGYLTQSDTAAFFGLGEIAVIDEVEVLWNDGRITILRDVAANQTLLVRARAAADINFSGFVDLADLNLLLRHYGQSAGPGSGIEDVDISGNGMIDMDDLTALLAAFGTDGC